MPVIIYIYACMSVHCMQKHVRACLFLGTVKAHVQCSFLVSGVHLETDGRREREREREREKKQAIEHVHRHACSHACLLPG